MLRCLGKKLLSPPWLAVSPSPAASSFGRGNSTLVIAEHDNVALTSVTLNAISAAKKIGGDVSCFVAGESCDGAVSALRQVEGVSRILVAEGPVFKGFLPEALAPVLLESQKQFGFSHIAVRGRTWIQAG